MSHGAVPAFQTRSTPHPRGCSTAWWLEVEAALRDKDGGCRSPSEGQRRFGPGFMQPPLRRTTGPLEQVSAGLMIYLSTVFLCFNECLKARAASQDEASPLASVAFRRRQDTDALLSMNVYFIKYVISTTCANLPKVKRNTDLFPKRWLP